MRSISRNEEFTRDWRTLRKRDKSLNRKKARSLARGREKFIQKKKPIKLSYNSTRAQNIRNKRIFCEILKRRHRVSLSKIVKLARVAHARTPSVAFVFSATGTDGASDDGGGDCDPDGQSEPPAQPSKIRTARPFQLQIFGAPVSARNQRQKIIQFLLDGGTATQRDFRALFVMEQPAARICELRKVGWRINSLHLDQESPQTVTYALDLKKPFIKPRAKKIKPTPTMTLPFDTVNKVADACHALLSAIKGGDVR